jgi:dinuclear metal center YbgI/SA1388 family protein
MPLRLSEYLEILNSISPFELQEKWDNSGLQVGDLRQTIDRVYVCIDLDEELVERLPEGSLLITHHPLIFSPLKSLEASGYPAKLLMRLVQKKIALVAMHTNFDKTHLNAYVATKVLGAREVECEDFVCYFKKSCTFDEALDWVSERLGLECVRYVPCKKIERVALTTGSGGSLMDEVRADLFLTGDLKYHDAMKAKNLGLGVIDIGHFESERYFAQVMQEQLKKNEIEAIIAQIKNPLHYKGRQ